MRRSPSTPTAPRPITILPASMSFRAGYLRRCRRLSAPQSWQNSARPDGTDRDGALSAGDGDAAASGPDGAAADPVADAVSSGGVLPLHESALLRRGSMPMRRHRPGAADKRQACDLRLRRIMQHSTADTRRFLVETFSDEELKVLCFDYFHDVYDDFTTGMTKTQMIQLLIARCVQPARSPTWMRRYRRNGRPSMSSGSGRRLPRRPLLRRLPPAVIRTRSSSATRTRTQPSPTGWRSTWGVPAGGFGSPPTASCRERSGSRRSVAGWIAAASSLPS